MPDSEQDLFHLFIDIGACKLERLVGTFVGLIVWLFDCLFVQSFGAFDRLFVQSFGAFDRSFIQLFGAFDRLFVWCLFPGRT